MNKRLKKRLAELHSGERRKLLQAAARLHREEQEQLSRGRGPLRGRPKRNEIGGFVKQRRRSSRTLDEWIERLLDEDRSAQEEAALDDVTSQTREATVTWVGPGSCRITIDGEEVGCHLSESLVREQKTSVAVGDVGLVEERAGTWRMRALVPRTTWLSRPDPRNPRLERCIAANMEAVVVVTAVKEPPLRVRLLDRYLVAIQRGGARPVVCVNKMDLADADDRDAALEKLRVHRDAGITVLTCSASSGEGVEELRGELAGSLCVFVGHSGVGKSSILNALEPGLALRTGHVDRQSGQGKHTTTWSTLHALSDGTRIMDTPGIREFGVWMGESGEELDDAFPDIRDAAEGCRFVDCTHDHEPGCAVKQAVQRGEIPQVRHDSYLSLAKEQRRRA